MKLKFNTHTTALLSVVAAFIVALVIAPVSFALDLTLRNGVNSARGADQPADLFGTGGVFSTITNVLLFILGAVSVIMIIIGGLRYVISGGDSTAVTAAKNTILYAIVGVIVAILAYAVINFVIGSLVPGGTSTGGV